LQFEAFAVIEKGHFRFKGAEMNKGIHGLKGLGSSLDLLF
jgi:hypothetical protein